MASLCGVCQTEPSKYRCPACDLRYCSIVCYKTHKVEHVSDTTLTSTAPIVSTTDSTSKPASRRPLIGSKKVDFSDVENDPQLLELLKNHKGLRVQLQSVYGFTLEPSPEERRFQRSQRGGRGGRGGRDHLRSQTSHGSWTQAKGDKEAQAQLKRLREADVDGGVAEFVRLVKMKYARNCE